MRRRVLNTPGTVPTEVNNRPEASVAAMGFSWVKALLVGIVAGLVGVAFVKVFHYTRLKIAPRFRPEVSALTGVAVSALITFTLLKIVSEEVPFGAKLFIHFNRICRQI